MYDKFCFLVIASFTLANNKDLKKSTYKQPHIIRLVTKAHWEPNHLNAPDGADGIAVRSVVCIMARINQPFVIEKYTLDYIKSNFLIGARAGSNALHALEEKNYNVSLIPQTENQLLQALERNRVNAIIENSLVFDTLIKKTKRDPDDFHKVLFGKKIWEFTLVDTFRPKNLDSWPNLTVIFPHALY